MSYQSASLEFYKANLRDLPLMPDVLSTLGIEVPRSRRIRNPNYADRNPDVQVHQNFVKDYGSSEKAMDTLDVCLQWGHMKLESAVNLLAKIAGVNPPTEAPVTVQPVKARPLSESPRVDASEFTNLAKQAAIAYQNGESTAAKKAQEYMASRGLIEAPFMTGVGVIDHTITASLPSFKWNGVITLPSWVENQVAAIKVRNTAVEKAARFYDSLRGVRPPLYNLEAALLSSDTQLLLVEGEIDTLSVIESGIYYVAGIPGANNWFSTLKNIDLGSRQLMVALDGDKAGIEATKGILEWAKTNGIAAHAVDCGNTDKNDLLQELGAEGFKTLLNTAMWSAFDGSKTRARKALR